MATTAVNATPEAANQKPGESPSRMRKMFNGVKRIAARHAKVWPIEIGPLTFSLIL
jgi:hypothetical protein